MATKKLFALDFEIFGRVQGVFFRKHTKKRALILGLRGWCRNTSNGTVKGQLEGPIDELNEMKHWLRNEGSPSSRIDKTIFSEWKPIDDYTLNTFAINH